MDISNNAKNMEKHYSYKLAFERIALAIENNFPLEAIAIEESIICDRLRAYCEVNRLGKISINFNDILRQASDYAIVNCNELYDMIGLKDDELGNTCKDASNSIDMWRLERNNLLHCIVRTQKSGQAPIIPASDFLKRALEIARFGREHAKKICNLSNKLRRQREKVLKLQKNDLKQK